MSLHLPELVDPDAVDDYLFDHLTDTVTDEAIAEASALADEGLSFSEPPAGAHVLRARLAELDDDLEAFERHTRAALAIDGSFGPAVEDEDYLGFLRAGAGPRASRARRAELLFHKADRWSDRAPQLEATRALLARVLPEHLVEHPAAVAVASFWQFLGFLLFEAGELDRFARACGPLLAHAERDMLASWQEVRHRLVRLEEQQGRRGRFVDALTGELIDVTMLHAPGSWRPGRLGLALLVPAGQRHALIGEPVLMDEATCMRDALADDDPLAVAELCLLNVLVAKLGLIDGSSAA